MYTILIRDDNSMIATVKCAIMQRSSHVDSLLFLCPKLYGDEDMSTYNSVLLEYVSPVSRTYRQEELVLQDELYKEHLQYILPVTTKLTAEAGEVDLNITFIKVEMDADTGVPYERVRKVNGYKLNIIPTANWAQFIPDESLTAIDQRIAKLAALQESGIGSGESEEKNSPVIDDTMPSELSTYSSQKIEDRFISDDELADFGEDVIKTDAVLILDGGTAEGE